MIAVEKKEKNANIFSVYLLGFIIACFLGWVYETVLTSAVEGRFVDRGVLPVPLLPIYGVFAVAIGFILKKDTHWFKVFVIGTVGTTVFEYICSVVTEKIFGYMLWDYFQWKLNFQGRISLFSSIIFGAFCVLYVKGVAPLAELVHEKFPKAAVIFTFALALINLGVCIWRWTAV